MSALTELGDQSGAIAVYEEPASAAHERLCIFPSDETTALYRVASNALNDKQISIEALQEHLKDDAAGAMQCEYDYFRVLCTPRARAMVRTGRVAHIALFSIGSKTTKPLTGRNHDRVMELFADHIRTTSAVATPSPAAACRSSSSCSQRPTMKTVIWLPPYHRILQQQHPHSPAKFHFMVQPLTSTV